MLFAVLRVVSAGLVLVVLNLPVSDSIQSSSECISFPRKGKVKFCRSENGCYETQLTTSVQHYPVSQSVSRHMTRAAAACAYYRAGAVA